MNTLTDFFNEQIQKNNELLLTDKGTYHDYINSYYNEVFTPFQLKNIKLLEIGTYFGSSVRLWREYFKNAEIHTMDITNYYFVNFSGESIYNIYYHIHDAYTSTALTMFQDNYFDFIIDDGPHTLESQLYFLEYWITKIKSDGKMIIEDIMGDDSIQYLINKAKQLNLKYKVINLRENKNRFDDVILEIIK